MSQWSTPRQQVHALAKAVSAAFAASNLTPEQKHPNIIEITDLPWSAPPLITDLRLGGVPLQDYIDGPVPLAEDHLASIWRRALADMWLQPGRLVTRGVLQKSIELMPGAANGHRAFRFSIPVGYPGQLDQEAGIIFTLELVHAIRVSMGFDRLVENESNYYVKLHSGQIIGIQDGRIACESPWTMDVSGEVSEMLRMSRGQTHYRCDFDQIAAVRSVLHVHRKSFPDNFDALDLALQTLRIVSEKLAVPALVHEMRVQPIDLYRMKEKARTIADAIEVMSASMPDRDKLNVLKASLVPGIIGNSVFKQHIFSGPVFPFALPQQKLESILSYLEGLYRALPYEVRQEGVCRPVDTA